jgi:hypothetical protein
LRPSRRPPGLAHRESTLARGNEEFACKQRRRLVEERHAEYRGALSGLGQVVFRVDTIEHANFGGPV